MRKRRIKYKKIQIAQERLMLEYDIQYIISMNRINTILHKIYLNKYQRQAINFSLKYMISDKEAEHALKSKKEQAATN